MKRFICIIGAGLLAGLLAGCVSPPAKKPAIAMAARPLTAAQDQPPLPPIEPATKTFGAKAVSQGDAALKMRSLLTVAAPPMRMPINWQYRLPMPAPGYAFAIYESTNLVNFYLRAVVDAPPYYVPYTNGPVGFYKVKVIANGVESEWATK